MKIYKSAIRTLIFTFFLLLSFFTKQSTAQIGVVSNTKQYLAVCAYQMRDTLISLEQKGKIIDQKHFYCKFVVNIYNVRNYELIYTFEAPQLETQTNSPAFNIEFSNQDEYVCLLANKTKLYLINTHKKIVQEYLCKDYVLNKNKTQAFLLNKKGISVLDIQSSQIKNEIKAQTRRYNTLQLTDNDQFIILSGNSRKNKSYFVIKVNAPDKNFKTKGNNLIYNKKNNEFVIFNNGYLSFFKLRNLKEKKVNLNKKPNFKIYRKYYTNTLLSPTQAYLALPVKDKIIMYNTKGNKLQEIQKPEYFTNAKWQNDTLIINSKSATYIYILKENDWVKTQILPLSSNSTNGEIVFLPSKMQGIKKQKNGFLFFNSIKTTKTLPYSFVNFDKTGNFIFAKKNQFDIVLFNVHDLQADKMNPTKLPSKRISLVSPLPFSSFYNNSKNTFVSQNSHYFCNPIFNTKAHDIKVITQPKQIIPTKNNGNTTTITIIDTIAAVEISYTNNLVFFNAEKEEIKRIEADKLTTSVPIFKNLSKTIENPYLKNKLEDSISIQYFNLHKDYYKIKNIRVTDNGIAIIQNKLTNKSIKALEICDLKNEVSLQSIPYSDVYYSENNKILAISNLKTTSLFNTQKNKFIFKKDIVFDAIFPSNDTSYFIGKKYPNIYFVETQKEETKIPENKILISKDTKQILGISQKYDKATLYQLPDLKVIKTFEIAPQYKQLVKKGLLFPCPDASKFAVYYDYKIYFFGTDSVYKISNIDNHNPIYWLDNQNVILAKNNETVIYNTLNQTYENQQNLNFYFPDSHIQQAKPENYKSFLSKSTKLLVLQENKEEGKTLFFKNTKQKERFYFIPNAQFISINPDESRIYFKENQNRVGYIETKEIFNNSPADSLKIKSFKVPLRSTRILPGNPSMISYDEKPPKGYHFERITSFKNISQAKDSLIGIYAHNIISDGRNVSVNLHLIDKAGNYYTGAASPEFQKIWCEIWLKFKNGKTVPIKHFKVSEVTRATARKSALALVLDHSGSMGNVRCFAIQKGAEIFIGQKRKDDKISVVKFDDHSTIEVNLNANQEKLLSKLQLIGDEGFGGSTALYDGIYEAIEEVSKAPSKTERAVIVMTDGYENSSFTYFNELILFAIEKKVKIYTIGFGSWINHPVLQTMAYQTGGSYYQLYKTQNFKWIFNDVYNKITNYYTISFKTPKVGKYAVLINVCHDLINNALIVAFDNTKINYHKIDAKGNDAFGVSMVNLSDSLSKTKFLKGEKIINLDKFVNKSGANFDWYTKKEFDNIKFPDIKFLTDKTVIVKGTDKGLNEVINFMQKHPEIIISITGHTDNEGSPEKNMKLSENRAKKIRQIMIKKGINKNRILVYWKGETNPLTTNNSKEGKYQNRRVEFSIFGQ